MIVGHTSINILYIYCIKTRGNAMQFILCTVRTEKIIIIKFQNQEKISLFDTRTYDTCECNGK